MSSISSDLYEKILKPNTNCIIQIVPCKTDLSKNLIHVKYKMFTF